MRGGGRPGVQVVNAAGGGRAAVRRGGDWLGGWPTQTLKPPELEAISQ